MRHIRLCLFLLHLTTVKWVDAHSIAGLLPEQFPDKMVTVNIGESRNFTCGTASVDPVSLVAWYKASTDGRILFRLTEWTPQNSTFTLRNMTVDDTSVYVCHVDTSAVFRSLRGYSFQLVVKESGMKQSNFTAASQGEKTRLLVDTNSKDGEKDEILNETTGKLEGNQQTNDELNSTTTSVLYVIAVVQVIGIVILALMGYTYYKLRRLALIQRYRKFFQSESEDIQEAQTQATTAASTPAPWRPSELTERTFQSRSKSMRPPKRTNDDLEMKVRSLTSQKKKSVDNVRIDGNGRKSIQKRAKPKATVEKRSSNEDERDLSPSIVPLERSTSTKTVKFGTPTQLDRLLSEDSGDVKWDTYNSLMEESLINPVFEKEQKKPKRRTKDKTKQPKQSEIDPYVRDDDEYWKEIALRSSTPKKIKRSKSAIERPSSPRRKITPSPLVTVDAPNETHTKKRASQDERICWPHENEHLQEQTQPKPQLLMLHPGLKDDESAFTPNLVRRLKTLYDQGFSIQIT